jgi:small subunit ribosomal protein S18
MARKKRQTRTKRVVRKYSKCPFCEAKIDPDYKNHEDLSKLMTDRAKIIGGKRSGVCSRHQRKLTVAIKRARHLGLLPFTPSI